MSKEHADRSPLKLTRFMLYFHRYGEHDWVLKARGKPARLTRDFQCIGTFAPGQITSQIRKHQPKAVIVGRAVVKYSRRLTVIVGHAA